MKWNPIILVFGGIITLLLLSLRSGDVFINSFQVPKGWPEPFYSFHSNPLTKDGFELGRKLFYDPSLSVDSTVSCASCHLQYTAFTHVDHAVSHGINGRKGTRNAPALVNLAWNKHFHWDGGVNHLDAQGLNPIEHPTEMGNSLKEVIRRLESDPAYKNGFNRTFGEGPITSSNLLKALSQFTIQLVSANSKYDQVMRKEEGVAFSEQERRGLHIFRKHCSTCHQEPLFNANFFASNGLTPDSLLNDLGRFQVTLLPKDKYLFKVPTLRNIAYSYPYMHDGRFQKLKDVINYYSSGINSNAKNLHQSLKKPKKFSEIEKKDLLAFLLTLTDQAFLRNKDFSFPR
jgi:cytochrome c peroxidase